MGILVPSTIKLRNAIIESAINDDYKLYTATTAKIEEFFDTFSRETKTPVQYIRFYWLSKSFGYYVYKEGFNIAFDFDFGVEIKL